MTGKTLLAFTYVALFTAGKDINLFLRNLNTENGTRETWMSSILWQPSLLV